MKLPAVSKAEMVSPSRVPVKRKTVITESGTKRIIDKNEGQASPTAGSATATRLAQRRDKKKAKASDVFGDFFGFGANPPGAMSKGTEPVDLKKEKERFMGLLQTETKRYDLDAMNRNLEMKTDTIVKGI